MRAGTRKGFKGAVMALFLFLAFLVSSGCSRKAETKGDIETEQVLENYSLGQIKTVAITERNRYQNIYTRQIWKVTDGNDPDTFEDRVMDQVRLFFIELGTVTMMADQEGVELTGQEKDSLRRLTDQYYNLLTQEDRDYLGVTQEEIYDLYCEYYRAEKLASSLTGGDDLEVSDAEAKVIRVQQIVLPDETEALEVQSQIGAEGSDFAAVAKKYSRNGQIEVSMEYTGQGGELEQTAFGLEEGQVSGIILQDGEYYILKCVDAYDQKATDVRKEILEQEKKREAFEQFYEPFAAKHIAVLQEDLWRQVSFAGGDDCRTSNFFELYRKHFAN